MSCRLTRPLACSRAGEPGLEVVLPGASMGLDGGGSPTVISLTWSRGTPYHESLLSYVVAGRAPDLPEHEHGPAVTNSG